MEPFAKNITTPTFLNSCGRNVLDPIDCEPSLFNHVLLIEKEDEKTLFPFPCFCLFLLVCFFQFIKVQREVS